ncbi:MAG: DUF4907 domain-containing protein [Bacteroidota bacterium]
MKVLFMLMAFIMMMTVQAQNNQGQDQGSSKFPGKAALKTAACTYNIIPSENKTWGYDIYIEKRLFIHQPAVPGLQGKDGFKTRAGAEKVARLVTGKIKKGEMPPSVTVEEMKKLKVL